MSIISFSRQHRPHVEVFTVRDRGSGKRLHVFELVGHDEAGPFRVDMAHRYTAGDLLDEIESWRRAGIEVCDVGVIL